MPKRHSRPALDEVLPSLHDRAPNASVPRLLTEAQVLGLVPISRVTLWRWEANGEFPKRVRLGEVRVGWPESEVNAWIQDRMAARTVEPNSAA
jgi:prophage regulatory protein